MLDGDHGKAKPVQIRQLFGKNGKRIGNIALDQISAGEQENNGRFFVDLLRRKLKPELQLPVIDHLVGQNLEGGLILCFGHVAGIPVGVDSGRYGCCFRGLWGDGFTSIAAGKDDKQHWQKK